MNIFDLAHFLMTLLVVSTYAIAVILVDTTTYTPNQIRMLRI